MTRAAIIGILSCLAVAGATTSISAQSQSSVEGVWRIDQITTRDATGTPYRPTQPSLYFFTEKHYSVITVASDSPRRRLADDRTATAQELLEVYVNAFIANAGTYELNGGKLTMRPTIAKDPGTMVPGTFLRFVYKRAGDTLTIQDDGTSWGGAGSNPSILKLVRVE